MPETPKFLGPDGTLREDYSFSTTIESHFFTGTIDADTVFMQISVFGQPFEDDPDLITFEGTQFIVPNPAKYPDGLRLFPGDNTIQVRSVVTSGATSNPANLDVRLIQDSDTGLIYEAPTGIYTERGDQIVTVILDGLDDDSVQGYNFYASTQPGGGTEGYSQINTKLVIDVADVEETLTTLGTLSVDAQILTDSNGDPVADPLMYRVEGSQENITGTVLQRDYNERLEIPESATQVRTAMTISSVGKQKKYEFVHARSAGFNSSPYPAIPNGDFAATPTTDPLYYVATAVYYDSDRRLEVESPFSIEIPANPLVVTPVVGAFPTVSRQAIVRETINSIYRSNPDVAVQPGAVLRDTFIDPFSSEAERIRFILDFLHRAQSFATLLEIDDPQNSGFSIPVQQSSYKLALAQAFFLTDIRQVQNLINMCFDKLAANYGVIRKTGTRSRGELTFYLKSRPNRSYLIPLGTQVPGSSVTARTTSVARIDLDNLATYFDATTNTYRVKAFAQVTSPGTAGNVAEGQFRTVPSIPDLFVTNEDSFFGGTNQETNRQLATRAQYSIASVDSGTDLGYWSTVAKIPGVVELKVISSGEEYMERDLDANGVHKGGKVDVWVRGDNPASVTDTFAFTFETRYDVQFEVIGDPQDLIFRAVDSNLSEDFPIIEMLDYPSHNPRIGFRNASKGTYFVLDDYTFLSYDTIQLSSEFNDPATIAVTDVIMGDYRYRTSNQFVLLRQPVTEVTAMTGQTGYTGALDPSLYTLYRIQSPLLLGRSSMASDYVQVSSDDRVGQIISVPDEEHVLIGEAVDYLSFLGVNPLSIVVKDKNDTSIIYNSPDTADPDYRIIEDPDPRVPTGIQRTETTQITSGTEVLIDYEHDENFTIEYKTNSIVGVVQSVIDGMRHITADVVVKLALGTSVDIAGTNVLVKGTTANPATPRDQIDQQVRTRVSNKFNTLRMKNALGQSDVITEIKKVVQVDDVLVPLTKLARADGSMVLRESLDTSAAEDLVQIMAWSTDTVHTYLVEDQLSSSTTNGGGPDNEYRAVIQDDVAMNLQTTIPNSAGVPLKLDPNNTFIIGSGGLIIPGYSDLDTLRLQYPTMTDTELYAQAVLITADRILVTVEANDSPTNHQYAVTYIVSGDTGARKIIPKDVEYLVPGDQSYVYDEASEE